MNDKQKINLWNIITTLDRKKQSKQYFTTIFFKDVSKEKDQENYIEYLVWNLNSNTRVTKYIPFNQEAIDILTDYEFKVQEKFASLKQTLDEKLPENYSEAGKFKQSLMILKMTPELIKYSTSLNKLKRITYKQLIVALK